MNFTKSMKFITKNIDNFCFIGYYYHIVNDKHQLKINIHLMGRLGIRRQRYIPID